MLRKFVKFFHPKKENTVPNKETMTPKYIKVCGGEKKDSGLFNKWFVTSQLPPTVTNKIPKLTKIFPIKKI
ncbi:MAG: hypothetical protein ACRBB2_01010 [Nitrosopumilus sp.]